MDPVLKVGVISSAHGLRGEVKVYPTTDDPARFKRLHSVLVGDDAAPFEALRECRIEHTKLALPMVIVKLAGVDSVDDVPKLVQKCLYVPRAEAVPLGEDEYFVADLIGMDVYDETGAHVGRVLDVMSAAANDVYITALDPEYAGGRTEVLLPAIKDCILDIDICASRMTVHMMPGLLD